MLAEECDGTRLGRAACDESFVRNAGELESEGLSVKFNSSAQPGPYIFSNQSLNLLSLFFKG